MSDGLTIWVRQRLADIKERVRELFRRQVRKLVELVLTDVDLMARLRDATTRRRSRSSICATPRASRPASRCTAPCCARSGTRTACIWNSASTKATRSTISPSSRRTRPGTASIRSRDCPRPGRSAPRPAPSASAGNLPPVRGNVRLTKGFFENTLPGFVAQHPGAKIALLHIDCDLYSSTVTILKNVGDRCWCPAALSSSTS